jgi:hypothetical protein
MRVQISRQVIKELGILVGFVNSARAPKIDILPPLFPVLAFYQTCNAYFAKFFLDKVTTLSY